MSSAHNKFISNKEAIPIVETDIFGGDDDALLAIARVGAEDVITGKDPIALGYAQLRANVYIDQTRMLEPAHRRPDGGEHDDDDARSMHFVGLENRGNNIAAIVGAMRLIRKTPDHPQDLPIEDFFAGELDGLTIGHGSFEVSRFISRNDVRRYQSLTRIGITSVGLAHAVKHDWGPCLAVVEPPVARSLSLMTGAAVSEIAPPRVIEKYNDVNLGIQVDLGKFAQHVGENVLNSLYLTDNNVPSVFLRKSDEPR